MYHTYEICTINSRQRRVHQQQPANRVGATTSARQAASTCTDSGGITPASPYSFARFLTLCVSYIADASTSAAGSMIHAPACSPYSGPNSAATARTRTAVRMSYVLSGHGIERCQQISLHASRGASHRGGDTPPTPAFRFRRAARP